MIQKNNQQLKILGSSEPKKLIPTMVRISSPIIKQAQLSFENTIVALIKAPDAQGNKLSMLVQLTRWGKELKRLPEQLYQPLQFSIHRQKYVIVYTKDINKPQSYVYLWNLENHHYIKYYLDDSTSGTLEVFQESGIVCILDVNSSTAGSIIYLKINYETQTMTKILHNKYMCNRYHDNKVIKIDNFSKLAFVHEEYEYDNKNIQTKICSIQSGQGQAEGEQDGQGKIKNQQQEASSYKLVWNNVAVCLSKLNKIWGHQYNCGIKIINVQMVAEDTIYLQIKNTYGNYGHLYQNLLTNQPKLSKLNITNNSHYLFASSRTHGEFSIHRQQPIYFIEYKNNTQKLLGLNCCEPYPTGKRRSTESRPRSRNRAVKELELEPVSYHVGYHQIYNTRYDPNDRCMILNIWDVFKWGVQYDVGLVTVFYIEQIVKNCDDDLLQFAYQMVNQQAEQVRSTPTRTIEYKDIIQIIEFSESEIFQNLINLPTVSYNKY